MANNTLSDLNNHLFAQLERLGDEELDQEQLQKQMERAKAINGIAKIALDGAQFAYEKLPGDKPIPEQFRLKAKDSDSNKNH